MEGKNNMNSGGTRCFRNRTNKLTSYLIETIQKSAIVGSGFILRKVLERRFWPPYAFEKKLGTRFITGLIVKKQILIMIIMIIFIIII